MKIQSYGILWARAKAVLHIKGKGKKGLEWLGICGFSKRVCKVAPPNDMMTVLVVNNLYVTNGVCEEGTRCVDKDCPLNKTTWESFCKGNGLPEKTPAPEHFGIVPIDYNNGPGGALNDFSWLWEGYDTHAPGGIIEIRKKERPPNPRQ